MANSLPNILQATSDFESWLAKHVSIVRKDIQFKHAAMAEAAFPFLRATFYRYAQLWPHVCEDLAKAPHLLAVGDLHIENFGTWRDSEGRLIWAVNDLDEASSASYAGDLVRLTASAYLAVDADHLSVARREVAEAVEEGYRDGVNEGGAPFVLAEMHRWLRLLALGKLRDPVRFWEKMENLEEHSGKAPEEARRLINAELPKGIRDVQWKRRVAGLGSLGHPRIVALARAQGAWIAREAKAMRPSAWVWARSGGTAEVYSDKLAAAAIRVPDPFLKFHERWLVRRLAPDCSRIELASLPKERDEAKLLYSMGRETANVHWGSPSEMTRVKNDLARRKGRWLHDAAKAMCDATQEDWEEWRRGWKRFRSKGSKS